MTKMQAATEIARRLREHGHQAYFAGGCVRDLLLGREPEDFDIATSAPPETVLDLFPKSYAVGAHFGVVLVVMAEDEARRFVTEVATFRSDGDYSDGRRPDNVIFTRSVEEDVRRRDFTINGMLLDPAKLAANVDDAVLDYVGGRADLKAGVVRAIGDAALRIREDRLRMLRAVRFAARFDFSIEPETLAAIRAEAHNIDGVSSERTREELTRMLTEGRSRRAFELLDETGLLEHVLPEVARMKGVEQPPQFHPEGDVWIHILMVLEQLAAGAAPTLAWGALLHDVGKPATFRRAPDRIRFDGHVDVGVRIAEAVLRRLRFSNEETSQIIALIHNHMRFGDVREMKESTLKRFFRLHDFPEHLALHRMDCSASHGDLSLYEFAKERFENILAEHVRPWAFLTGKDLIAAGYRPGPDFKEMLDVAEDAQLEGRVSNAEEALALIRMEFPALEEPPSPPGVLKS